MSVVTPSIALSAASLQDRLRGLDLPGTSPLMRTVARDIQSIELALARGVTYKQIASAIVTGSGPANPKTLRECVYRIRKRVAAAGSGPRTCSISGTTSATTAAVPSTASAASAAQHPSQSPSVKSASDPTPADRSNPSPDFIRDILASTPDLDELARQYRARKSAGRGASSLFASPSPQPPSPNPAGTTP